MTGLLIKDYYLLTQRKQTLVLFVVISLMIGYTMESSFVVGYMTMLSCMQATGTIAYDEADNGMLFLMSLPADKKTYARSKYVLGFLLCGITWVLGVVLMFALYAVKGTEFIWTDELISAVALIPAFLVMMDVMIPLMLKYGAEKSRVVLALIVGVGVALCGAASVIMIIDDECVSAVLLFLDSVPELLIGGGLVVFCGVITVISMKISCRIMEKKEF